MQLALNKNGFRCLIHIQRPIDFWTPYIYTHIKALTSSQQITVSEANRGKKTIMEAAKLLKAKGQSQRIVVAVDESEESMYALQWCLSNLTSPDTKNTLILLYVKPSPAISLSSFDAPGKIAENFSIQAPEIVILILILILISVCIFVL